MDTQVWPSKNWKPRSFWNLEWFEKAVLILKLGIFQNQHCSFRNYRKEKKNYLTFSHYSPKLTMGHTSIKCTLHKFCKNDYFKSKLNDITLNVNKIIFKAYHLANLYTVWLNYSSIASRIFCQCNCINIQTLQMRGDEI